MKFQLSCILILICILPVFSQKNFKKEFQHGEDDKFHGRIFYQISVEQGGQILPSDRRSLRLTPERIDEEIRVTVLFTKLDLAYKKSTFEEKAQDKEPEAFLVEFAVPPNPSYGIYELAGSNKIYDQHVNIGTNSTKVIFRFTCSNQATVQSAINLSFKVLFSPRGREGVNDSPEININIPVTIDAPLDVYQAELRMNEAREEYERLYMALSRDPKRKNQKVYADIKAFLQTYGDIKNEAIEQMKKALQSYERREDTPEDAYERIKNFEKAVMLQNANGDINMYIENCIQKVWTDCPHLQEVRYLQIVNNKFDTTLINNFFKVYRNSQYTAELIEQRQRIRDRKRSGRSSSGGGSAGGGYYSGDKQDSDVEESEEMNMDSMVIKEEPADVLVEYDKALRRITVEKTGDWEDVNYLYELVGEKGKQGQRILGGSKKRNIYIDDLDYENDNYTLHIYKRVGNDKPQLLHNSIRFSIERELFNTNWFLYGFIALLLGGLYFLYNKYIKI